MKKNMFAALALAFVFGLGSMSLFAEEGKKLPLDKDGCCAKAAADGKACAHPCCVEAGKKNESCKKCNKENGGKALFSKDSCCAKAAADGKACGHPCCSAALKKGEVCGKCNK